MTLTVHCELWTQNANDRMHWRPRAKKISDARWAARIAALAARVPKGLGRARISVTPLQGPRGPSGDPGAYLPTVKACLDGLRDAGVLTDDTDTYVEAIELLPSERVTAHDTGLRIQLTSERRV